MSKNERTAGGGEISPAPTKEDKNQPKHEREDFRDKLREEVTGEKLPTPEEKKEALAHFKASPGDGKTKMVKLSELRESPFNPRRHFGDLKELAASIESMGVLEPIIVRRVDGKLEIVSGHRRYRAAKLAGIKEVRVIEHAGMTEVQAREVQLVENVQRLDVQPLEEAEAYESLNNQHHYTVDQIAEKVGKSKGWVYARMKLLSLCPEARKEMHGGRLSPTVAVPLARISSHKLQAEALQTICPPGWDPQSTRAALDFLQKRFTKTLKAAPFDTKSITLVPAAGACTKCPKRSGATPGLFDDLKGYDTCTDTPCFEKKVKASFEIKVAGFREKGMKVGSRADGLREFNGGKLRYHSAYVLSGAPAAGDKKKRTWAQLINVLDEKKRPAMIVLCDDRGVVRTCYRADEALGALSKDHGWAKAAAKDAAQGNFSNHSSHDQAKSQDEDTARRSALDLFAAGLIGGFKEMEVRELRLVVHALASTDDLPHEDGEELTPDKAAAWIDGASTPLLHRVLFTAAVKSMLRNQWGRFSEDSLRLEEHMDMKGHLAELFKVEKKRLADERKATETAAAAEDAMKKKITTATEQLGKDLESYAAEGEEMGKEMEKKAKKTVAAAEAEAS